MTKIRVYTIITDPDDQLIRACIRKKLTNIKITWYPAGSTTARGYILECDQIPYKRFHGLKKNVIDTVNAFQWVNGVLKY